MIRIAMLVISLSYALSSSTAEACPYADAAAFAKASEQVKSSDGAKASFAVEGLTCGSCSEKVVSALSRVEGVIASAVDYQTGRAEIAFDGVKTDTDKLLAAIVATGYTANLVVNEG